MALRESDAARARDNVVPLPRRRTGLRERLLGGMARVPEPGATIWPGPVAGLVASLWAAVMSLLVIGALVLATWVFAPLGSGQFADVMRASASSWLLADGGSLSWQGAQLSLAPLLGTLVIVLFQRRAGRWLVAAVAAERLPHVLPAFMFALIASASVQLLVLASIADGAPLSFAHNLLGAVLVALVGFGWGIDKELALERVQPWARIGHAVRTYLSVLAGAAVLLLLVLAVAHRRGFSDVLSAVAADSTSSMQVIGLCLVFVPTALLWIGATIVGPGFAVGSGTHVALSGVSIGALPPMPLLAFIPAHTSSSAPALMVLPAVAAALAAWQMRTDRSLVHRAIVVACGALAGALLGLAGSGAFGPGRLQQLGPVWWQVALACGGWLLAAFLVDEAAHQVRLRMAQGPTDAEEPAN